MEKINLPELHEARSLTPMPSKSANSLDATATEVYLRRMYLSASQAAPDALRMQLMVEDALRLWAAVPGLELPRMVDLAIIKAAPYVATAPLVAKCWEEKDHKELCLGDGARMSVGGTAQYLESLQKADEEKADPEFVAEFCGKVIAKLEGNPASREMA